MSSDGISGDGTSGIGCSTAQGARLGDVRVRRQRRQRSGLLHRIAARVRRALPR
jgi:hypothetical protein